ncbi:hypothetical protein Tco_1184609 [Tanacetum coccineum]
MATLKFADSHNMVAFLSKPAECEGFEQIVDFLNAYPIKYALGDISSRDEEDFGKDASKQGRRIHDTDADEDITLVNDDNKIFDVDALAGEEVFIAEQSKYIVEEVVNAAQTITTEEITFAQAPKELKSAKPKADKDKGKGIMIEEPVVEQVKPMKRLEQMRLDEELAFKLQAEEEEDEEEERLAREKAQQIEEANIAWDDVQAKVEADYQLAQRLQAQEQEELLKITC